MDELEGMIGSVLSDPEKMKRLSRMAGELFGDGASQPEPEKDKGSAFSLGPNQKTHREKNDRDALLAALLPLLHEERRAKLRKAMRFARMAKLAGGVLREFGGEGDGL